MQRWMLWAVLAVVGITLLGGGAYYGYREYWANQPDKIWVPLPLPASYSMAQQKELADKIEEKLRKEETLKSVVADLGLKEKFNVVDEGAAVKELNKRLFVDVGSADTPDGTVPSINIGVRGISRETELLTEMAMRIIRDVWEMIGIDPNTGKMKNRGETLDSPGGY
ncbi:MAG: hypothetical protein ACSHX9_04280 [Luteolibacter sp.]